MAHGPPAGIGFRHPGMVLVIAIISLNVGKSEEAALAVAGHLGVFAGIEPPADGVGMDAQEWAEIPRPIMGASREFLTCYTWSGGLLCRVFKGYLNFA